VPLVQNLKFHDYQFELAVSAGKWRWTTRLDVSQSSPVYSIRDIISPYGLLRDSIPIPGPVVQAMSASIDELMSNFIPGILIGPPTTLVFNVTEGEGFSESQLALVTNNGVYGSILDASLTASAAYLRVSPTTLGGLAINETGESTVEVDSTDLLASDSPYHESVVVQDPSASPTSQTLLVTVNVTPKATIATSTVLLVFNVVRPLSGIYPTVPTQTFNVTNSGPAGSVLSYDIRQLTGLCTNWLRSVLPASDSLDSGVSQVEVVTVQPPDNLLWGTYSETLRVSGYSTNSYVDVEIRLVIT
jgi:hypothetical protein